jgi:hypothetical protein
VHVFSHIALWMRKNGGIECASQAYFWVHLVCLNKHAMHEFFRVIYQKHEFRYSSSEKGLRKQPTMLLIFKQATKAEKADAHGASDKNRGSTNDVHILMCTYCVSTGKHSVSHLRRGPVHCWSRTTQHPLQCVDSLVLGSDEQRHSHGGSTQLADRPNMLLDWSAHRDTGRGNRSPSNTRKVYPWIPNASQAHDPAWLLTFPSHVQWSGSKHGSEFLLTSFLHCPEGIGVWCIFIPAADAHQVLLDEHYLLIVSWQLAGSKWFHWRLL